MECPYISQIRYGEFGKRIHNKAVIKRIPINGSIEPTFRCNLRCAHCYCNLPLNDKDAREKELKAKEIFDILDQIAEAGCLWLLITGGEPLVREDFLDIYTYAKKKGFIITLFTNGTLLTPQIADYLAEWPPFAVEITLYGITKETYEKVTQTPNSFERCVRGINLLLQRKIPLRLKTMVMKLNQDQVWQIKEYAEELGVEFRFDSVLNPRLDGSKDPCDLRLSPEEVVELDLADKKKFTQWQEFSSKFREPVGSDKLYYCLAGISSFHIDPYGKLSVCMMSRFQNCDLHNNSFREMWNHRIPQFLDLKPVRSYPCGECDLISLCGQCPGSAWLETGSPETPVQYLCQLAHLRARAFRKEINEKNGQKVEVCESKKAVSETTNKSS